VGVREREREREREKEKREEHLQAGVLMWGSFIIEDWCKQLGLENYFSSSFLNDNLHYAPLLFYVAAIPVLNIYYIQLAKVQ